MNTSAANSTGLIQQVLTALMQRQQGDIAGIQSNDQTQYGDKSSSCADGSCSSSSHLPGVSSSDNYGGCSSCSS